MHLCIWSFLATRGEWAVFVSSPARLLFLCRLNRAAASTRPGACAALRTSPLHACCSSIVTHNSCLNSASLQTNCLYSSRPRPCSCPLRTAFCSPPSIPSAATPQSRHNSLTSIVSTELRRSACLFVCLFVRAVPLYFVVPTRFRDLCALIENRVRSAGANIGHCPSQRKHPNVWYAVLAVRSSARTAPCRQQY